MYIFKETRLLSQSDKFYAKTITFKSAVSVNLLLGLIFPEYFVTFILRYNRFSIRSVPSIECKIFEKNNDAVSYTYSFQGVKDLWIGAR